MAVLFFYLAVILAFFATVAFVADTWERRERHRRIQRLRERRRYLDSLEPQRWQT